MKLTANKISSFFPRHVTIQLKNFSLIKLGYMPLTQKHTPIPASYQKT